MSLGKTLDLAIKANEAIEAMDSAYFVNGKHYPNYMSNAAWECFLSELKDQYPAAYCAFANGSGNELGLERKLIPPKMASYGSSSRMLFHLAKDIDGFRFEKKLPTTIGGISNLDGFYESDGMLTFVEAKCREPYEYPNKVINQKYKALYEYLNDAPDLPLSVEIPELIAKGMMVHFATPDGEIARFDIKQMICHLLAVATACLKKPTARSLHFVYLLYNPTLIEIGGEDEAKIHELYRQCKRECESIDFKKLFVVILRYLRCELGIGTAEAEELERIASSFTFTLCDQQTFPNLF